eukprot:Awhi_evm1s1438
MLDEKQPETVVQVIAFEDLQEIQDQEKFIRKFILEKIFEYIPCASSAQNNIKLATKKNFIAKIVSQQSTDNNNCNLYKTFKNIESDITEIMDQLKVFKENFNRLDILPVRTLLSRLKEAKRVMMCQ